MAPGPRIGAVIDPAHIAKIRNLQVRVTRIVEGLRAGLHKSPYHGFSSEFSEFRPYIQGESTGRIDWRKYARSDRTMVRLYEDETNLRAHLLLDTSASMGYTSSGVLSKFEYARTLVAALAWILIRQRDATGLTLFDSQEAWYAAPRSTQTHLRTCIGALSAATPGGETGCGRVLNRVAARQARRGLCIIVSDLLDDPDTIIQGLAHLRFKKQSVLLFRLSDPFEADFNPRGTLHLRDLENQRELKLDAGVAAQEYRQARAAHFQKITAACRDLHVELKTITTSEPFIGALSRTLRARSRLF